MQATPLKENKLIGVVLIPLKKKPSGRRRVVPTDDEDDQNPKKEKKQPSSIFRGVERQSWGRWQAEIHNPLARRRETITHKTEEESAAADDAVKAQRFMPECTALSSSSSLSCKQEEEAHDGVGVTDPEPTDESILNALLDQKDEVPFSDILAGKHSPRDD